jgi:hypothetical protein
MARSSTSIGGLRQQLRALKNRVTWLERAINPARKPVSPEVNRARDNAEEASRHEALMEYYRQRNVEFYKRHPDWLERERAQEREKNAFLRSRGFKPEPSNLPAEVRLKKR